MQTTVVTEAANKLRRELDRLEGEAAKVRKALAALDALDGKGTGIRARRNMIELKCKRCGNSFTSNRKDAMFCHNPCTSLLAMKERARATAPSKTKPTVLVKGDALKAGHP